MDVSELKRERERKNFAVDRPVFTLTVEHNGRIKKIPFLIDTGADLTLLSADNARDLGMSYTGEFVRIAGILGADIFFAKQVNISAEGLCPFTATVYINPNNHSNLLGRDILFKQFAVYMDKDRIILEQLGCKF